MNALNRPLRIGSGGPGGSGMTALVRRLCEAMRGRFSIAAVTNDIYAREDAMMLARAQALADDHIIGVETGGCPHTAIREDASINLAAIVELMSRHRDLGIVFIGSGGDSLAATFSPGLADVTLYVISVAHRGEDIPRKGGPGITRSDRLVINKTDLAPHVGVDLEIMRADVNRIRDGKPVVLTDLMHNEGLGPIVDFLISTGGLIAAFTGTAPGQ